MRRFILVLLIIWSSPSRADLPSNDMEWSQMQRACVVGLTDVKDRLGFNSFEIASACNCIRDLLKSRSTESEDAAFSSSREFCFSLQKALANREDLYPRASRDLLFQQCKSALIEDNSHSDDVCECEVMTVQLSIPWDDWMLLDSAIRAKSISRLDETEEKVLKKALDVKAYCSQKFK